MIKPPTDLLVIVSLSVYISSTATQKHTKLCSVDFHSLKPLVHLPKRCSVQSQCKVDENGSRGERERALIKGTEDRALPLVQLSEKQRAEKLSNREKSAEEWFRGQVQTSVKGRNEISLALSLSFTHAQSVRDYVDLNLLDGTDVQEVVRSFRVSISSTRFLLKLFLKTV